jgi:hypothetical protein
MRTTSQTEPASAVQSCLQRGSDSKSRDKLSQKRDLFVEGTYNNLHSEFLVHADDSPAQRLGFSSFKRREQLSEELAACAST